MRPGIVGRANGGVMFATELARRIVVALLCATRDGADHLLGFTARASKAVAQRSDDWLLALGAKPVQPMHARGKAQPLIEWIDDDGARIHDDQCVCGHRRGSHDRLTSDGVHDDACSVTAPAPEGCAFGPCCDCEHFRPWWGGIEIYDDDVPEGAEVRGGGHTVSPYPICDVEGCGQRAAVDGSDHRMLCVDCAAEGV